MRIYGWAVNHSGCGQYRIGIPMWALGRAGHDATAFSVLNTGIPADLDVLVGQLVCTPDRSSIWEQLAALPHPRPALVFELDDDIWNLHSSNHGAAPLADPEIRAALERNLALADAVTVTTVPLADIVSRFNPNVHVVPNCVDEALLSHQRTRNERVTIGWAGGSSHDNDFAFVRNELRSFLRRHPDVDVHMIGTDYRSALGRPDAQHSGWSENLVEYLGKINFDIGIAPLAYHAFNRSKSDLKVLEYAALGIPVVATDYGPYSDSVQHGVTGFLVKRPHEWARYLRDLVNDEAMRTEMGENARRWAATRTIQANVWRWEHACRSAIEHAASSSAPSAQRRDDAPRSADPSSTGQSPAGTAAGVAAEIEVVTQRLDHLVSQAGSPPPNARCHASVASAWLAPGTDLRRAAVGLRGSYAAIIGSADAEPTRIERTATLARLRPAFVGHRDDATIGLYEHPTIPRLTKAPDGFRVLAVMAVFNERDVIIPALRHLVDNGVQVHLVDNWSTDGTADLVREHFDGDEVTIERFPDRRPDTFDLTEILRHTEQVAWESGADWVIHHDADELREGPWPELTLRDCLYNVQLRGFNCVDHKGINFRPIDNRYTEGRDLAADFEFFEFEPPYLRINAWRNSQPVDLHDSGGHEVRFPGRRVFPYTFLLRHYPIRSQEHGERKVLRERKARWNADERGRGWHTHYDDMTEPTQFLWDRDQLLPFENFYDRFLLERIGGVTLSQPSLVAVP